MKRKGHVIIDACVPNGTVIRSTLSKSSLNHVPSLYTAVRKSTWGGLHPTLLEQPMKSPLSKSATKLGREQSYFQGQSKANDESNRNSDSNSFSKNSNDTTARDGWKISRKNVPGKRSSKENEDNHFLDEDLDDVEEVDEDTNTYVLADDIKVSRKGVAKTGRATGRGDQRGATDSFKIEAISGRGRSMSRKGASLSRDRSDNAILVSSNDAASTSASSREIREDFNNGNDGSTDKQIRARARESKRKLVSSSLLAHKLRRSGSALN